MRDITGQQFGVLTAIRPTSKRQDGSVIWEFECSCGWTVQRSLRNVMCSVRLNNTISCGCAQRDEDKYKYTIGQTYGKLTVINVEYSEKMKQMVLVCVCTCGSIKRFTPSTVLVGRQRSCSRTCRRVNPTLPHGIASAHSVYKLTKSNAKRSDIYFDLTFDQFYKISTNTCSICGASPCVEWRSADRYNGMFKHNKIAYICKERGYTLGNVITVCQEHAYEIRGLHARGIEPINYAKQTTT